MSISKGIWKIDFDKESKLPISISTNCNNICSFSNTCHLYPSKLEDNAQLIAAAPETKQQRDDLLAALKNWFVCADEHDILCRCGRDGALQVIAKAENQ